MEAQHRLDDTAVECWVQRSLRERYAAALREPLPEMLTKLLGPDTSGH